jgi:methylated-DNA-protein-cysteine methyltransferase-like protein
MNDAFAHRVLQVVASIPYGRATSYGEVATLAGSPRAARAVGTVLRISSTVLTPWHRVVNAGRRVSFCSDVERATMQVRLLEAEGVRFDGAGTIDASCWWNGDGAVSFVAAPQAIDLPFDGSFGRRRSPRTR